MSGVPERIWADPPETFDGSDVWRSEPGGKGVECIRADIAAARDAHLCGLIRRYVETVGDAEGVDFIGPNGYLSKDDCAELLSIAPRYNGEKT